VDPVSGFEPDLSILSPHQRALWPELKALPSHFVLYGGTGIALRLRHRQSVDFDFMSARPFTPEALEQQVPFLGGAERLQSKTNTLTVSVKRGAPVVLSFFGGIAFGRVGSPDRASENGLSIASLLDLAATKMGAVQQRAEAKDYLDVYAILRSGLSLEHALGAARALYGGQFNAAITLKALAYFGDGDLATLPDEVRRFLADKAAGVGSIPNLARSSPSLSPED
jgi:hypothetical protein